MEILKFNESFRQKLRDDAKGSLSFFNTAILGFDAWDEELGRGTVAPIHHDLCAFLEGRHPYGPWNRAVVCAARGLGKSTQVMGYAVWRAAHIVNFAVKYIGNTDTNVRDNHFLPILRLFTQSNRADFLQWLYQDRIPPDFAGWNSEQIRFVCTDPKAYASISYWGLSSKKEGNHPDLIINDDLDGADAEKSELPSISAMDCIAQCVPLCKHPRRSQILVVGTPWGNNPVVYQLRDRECDGSLDDPRRKWKLWWKEIVDDHGRSRWPERFDDETIESLRLEETWDTQYMLRRRARRVTIFDMAKIRANLYRFEDSRPGLLRYTSFELNPDKVGENGLLVPQPVQARVSLQEMRHFVHVDPTHRSDEMRRNLRSRGRPSRHTLAVCSIAPDHHAFCTHTWIGDEHAELDRLAEEVFRIYCLYAPHLVTIEAVGAQAWFMNFVKTMERESRYWARPMSAGYIAPPGELPPLSTRLIEADKVNQTKEWLFRERLCPWLHKGLLHLGSHQHDALSQLEHSEDESSPIDIADCLSQGMGLIPENSGRPDAGKMVWSAPIVDDLTRIINRRRFAETLLGPKGQRRWPKRATWQTAPNRRANPW